ncbi:hypothetical protein TARUN_2712 [Trichoderma arundinaceum]|uniref:Uncharacterized protein n=1 Tax=Trichoderma arundinaceum TaxID=490622 RepID=A0A395NU37_TRIAR|nr:hypothetical protein TARUN_2712 [Trichoderma arundinaceum]
MTSWCIARAHQERRVGHPICGGGFEPEEARSSTSSSEPATKASVCRPDAGLRCIGPALAWPDAAEHVRTQHQLHARIAAANRNQAATDPTGLALRPPPIIGSLAVEARRRQQIAAGL